MYYVKFLSIKQLNEPKNRNVLLLYHVDNLKLQSSECDRHRVVMLITSYRHRSAAVTSARPGLHYIAPRGQGHRFDTCHTPMLMSLSVGKKTNDHIADFCHIIRDVIRDRRPLSDGRGTGPGSALHHMCEVAGVKVRSGHYIA